MRHAVLADLDGPRVATGFLPKPEAAHDVGVLRRVGGQVGGARIQIAAEDFAQRLLFRLVEWR